MAHLGFPAFDRPQQVGSWFSSGYVDRRACAPVPVRFAARPPWPVSAMTRRSTPKRDRLSLVGAVLVALVALLQPAPIAAASYEFDLTYDPANGGRRRHAGDLLQPRRIRRRCRAAPAQQRRRRPQPACQPLARGPALPVGGSKRATRASRASSTRSAPRCRSRSSRRRRTAACSRIPCPAWPCGCGCRRATATGSPSRFGLACLRCARET